MFRWRRQVRGELWHRRHRPTESVVAWKKSWFRCIANTGSPGRTSACPAFRLKRGGMHVAEQAKCRRGHLRVPIGGRIVDKHRRRSDRDRRDDSHMAMQQRRTPNHEICDRDDERQGVARRDRFLKEQVENQVRPEAGDQCDAALTGRATAACTRPSIAKADHDSTGLPVAPRRDQLRPEACARNSDTVCVVASIATPAQILSSLIPERSPVRRSAREMIRSGMAHTRAPAT